MSTLTRSFLQSAQENRKQKDADQVAQRIVTQYILSAAEKGESRFVVTHSIIGSVCSTMFPLIMYAPEIPTVAEALRQKLPDCNVYVVTNIVGSQRKDAITIDWS